MRAAGALRKNALPLQLQLLPLPLSGGIADAALRRITLPSLSHLLFNGLAFPSTRHTPIVLAFGLSSPAGLDVARNFLPRP